MGWIETLVGATGKGLLEGVGGLAKDIRTAITGQEPINATKAAEIALQMAAIEAATAKAAIEYDVAQMQGAVDVAKIEASSTDKFQSRWRPAVGWVCVGGLSYTFLMKPLLPWAFTTMGIMSSSIASVVGVKLVPVVIPRLPEVPMGDLLVLLGGLLGLGTMRTVEKMKSK